MHSRLCGAIKRNGMPCGARVVVGGKRCRNHGGYSSGPTSIDGKLICSRNLRPGRKVGTKVRSPGERDAIAKAKLQRRIDYQKRQERRETRKAKWERRKRLEAGLPLLNQAELETL
jgi:hypothetical protein